MGLHVQVWLDQLKLGEAPLSCALVFDHVHTRIKQLVSLGMAVQYLTHKRNFVVSLLCCFVYHDNFIAIKGRVASDAMSNLSSIRTSSTKDSHDAYNSTT
eukprot:TRINITY_DN12125_c0_g1_i3.p1 TRINITY_DN12125_c0_g1~~TRINITY_DN12125_c0_g1_i3.p1  ORF type:complete len:100 (-),score=7.37 TRINITY_DN12125_c0_g1_i3:104-403(-)